MVNICDYNRIIIVGSGGSGKSWLSKQIATITGYPLYHLDNEFWKPNWVMTPHEEKVLQLKKIISGRQWIIDGNYDSTMEMRFASTDLIIFLDINRLVCAVSAAKRHGKKRSDLPNYLDEPTIFSKDFIEFIKWIWTYPKSGRKTVMALYKKYQDKPFLHIKTRREVIKFVKKWSALNND